MITNRELEKLISGHWKSLTRTQQLEMAREIMAYRKAQAEHCDDPAEQILGQFKRTGDGDG